MTIGSAWNPLENRPCEYFATQQTNQYPNDDRSEKPNCPDPINLFQELQRISLESETLDEVLSRCGRIISLQSICSGLWISTQSGESGFEQARSILAEPENTAWDSFGELGRELLKRAAGSQQIQIAGLPGRQSLHLVVAPVFCGSGIDMLIAGVFHRSETSGDFESLMGIAAQAVANWLYRKKLTDEQFRSRSLNDVISLTHDLDLADNLPDAAVVLVNQLKRLTNAGQAALATCRDNRIPQLVAVSDLDTIDPSLETSRAIAHACGSAIEAGQLVIYSARHSEGGSKAMALEQYCRSNGFDACINIPLVRESQRIIGSILLAVTPRQAADNGYIRYLEQVVNLFTGHLEVVLRANWSLTRHVAASLTEFWKGRVAKIIFALALASTAVLLIPWPYRVRCSCEIQPVVRRFIAAPHDGVLKQNLVENGDLIQKNQVVANLDGRQLQMELVGLQAELNGAGRKRSAAMASGRIAESQIDRSEINKLNSRIQQVQDKLDHLEIRSPIDGIVVAGDLEKVEGAPVQMGQTLFEVGPLDRMLAEIAIPEYEIPYVQPGMEIAIKLDAWPFKTWTGTIEKIHPKTEIRDRQSVFIAEVELLNSLRELKPGMNGQARIRSTTSPLGWNLFHRPFEQLRHWMFW